MTIQTWKTTANDTLTPLGVQLMQKNSVGSLAAVDLTGKTLKFKMVNDAGTTVIAETTTGITVIDAVNGKAQFDFSASHVVTPGIYWGWFTVFSGAETTTFPVGRNLQIVIAIDE